MTETSHHEPPEGGVHFLETLAQLSPVGIFRTDKRGDCVYVNSRWTEIAGVSLEQSLGDGWRLAIHPDDRDSVYAEWKSSVAEARRFRLTYRFLRPDGKVTWVQGESVAEKDVDGSVTGYLGVVTDITDYKKMEHALITSEERYRSLLSHNPGVLYTCMASGSFPTTYISPNVETQLGFHSEDFTNNPGFWADNIHPEDRERVFQDLQHLFEMDSHVHEYRFRNEAGSYRWMRDELRLIRDESGRPKEISGFWLDITDLKQMEFELRDNVAARDQFLSIASHELKTPLTGMALRLQLLRRQIAAYPGLVGSKLDATARETLRMSTRISDLLDVLLDITRLRIGKLVLDKFKTDMRKIAKANLSLIAEEAIERGVPIHFYAPEPVVGNWDPNRLGQIVSNLISNAVKYGEGKPIEVEVTLDKSTRRAKLIVKDHGMGIAPEMQDKIFERFERAAGEKYLDLASDFTLCASSLRRMKAPSTCKVCREKGRRLPSSCL